MARQHVVIVIIIIKKKKKNNNNLNDNSKLGTCVWARRKNRVNYNKIIKRRKKNGKLSERTREE